MPTPKGKKELKAEGTKKKLATLRAAFEAVKTDITPGADGFDVADQNDNIGHWHTHLQNLNGHIVVLESQAQGWIDREAAIRAEKDKADEEDEG